MAEPTDARSATRARIVEVAAALLSTSGPGAVTTRAVAERAGVQAPTIYRLFGDKDGLLEAVAEHVMATHVAAKAARQQAASAAGTDPLDDLRTSWTGQVEFGLAHPAVFWMMSEPSRLAASPTYRSGLQVLEDKLHRVAVTGCLRLSEQRAAALVQAAGVGTIQLLLSTPPEQRDPGLADSMYEAVLTQILTDAPPQADDGPTSTAVALRALAPRLEALTAAERGLLVEWLDRVVDAG